MGVQNYTQVCNSRTPFTLAFGTEAIAPVEVGLKSPKFEFANAEHNEESLRLNLDLLEEK